MKKFFLAAVCLLPFFYAAGQLPAEYYKSQYERQVKLLGSSGVGVETILNKWQRTYPEDTDMLEGRFAYFLSKSQTLEMVDRKERKYLGLKPSLELKDSLGIPHYYFQVPVYSDSLFALSASAIEKAISLRPDELKYQIDKISALISYEKESPDMAEAAVLALIDRHQATPSWTYGGEAQGDDFFQDLIQEYCFTFYSTGTPRSYDAFFKVSERMSKLYPKASVYVSNMGTYWLIAKDNPKKAMTFYKKALKLDPDDYAAKSNIKIIQSSQSQKGRSSK